MASSSRRGGGGRNMAVGLRPVSEADRISIMDRLEQFRHSSAQEMTFEAGLSNHDRAVVHTFCKKMGFRSKSHGFGEERRVTVYKTRKRQMKGPSPAVPISFCPETKEVLIEIFSSFPPTDDEGNRGVDEPSSISIDPTHTEEKPKCLLMTRNEILKQRELLAKRRQTMSSLKLIDEAREKLPITKFQDAVTSIVNQNQVVIVAGETGCGKSTQVPQFLLDHMWSQSKPCRVICTQPRRISATSVADRVACERGESIGETVGYQIRLESKGGSHSSLMFCTNGVLLRKLVMAKESGVHATHIIVDEIHERDCNADFLLIILKDLLLLQPDLRVVLMSATLDAELFSKYFNNCPILKIPGFTHPVKTYYLEDVLTLTKFDERSSNKAEEMDVDAEDEEADLVARYHKSVDQEEIDILLIERLLQSICISAKDNGAVLVFLPGWEDITRCRERLLSSYLFGEHSNYLILPLHSMIPMGEQKKIFQTPPNGVRKIVLATNIAETAITIDDVVYVIDSGKMKEKSYDPYTNVSTFQTAWISKASARQREGRAGRTQPGVCYHLFSKARAASLAEFQLPEMKRTPLEEVCLKVKLLQPKGDVREFLSKALDPPLDISIKNAMILLKDIGALTPDFELSELGRQLGSLPVHPSTSKMLLLAILLNCLEPALTIAVAADYREPFVLPITPDQKKQALAAKAELASTYGGYSDHLAIVAAFEGWENARKSGQENRFCSKYFLSSGVMFMLNGMRKQLLNELINKGFVPREHHPCSLNAKDPGIVRAIVAACVYPLVGKLLPPLPNGQKSVVEIAKGEKVRVHPHSTNFRLVTQRQEQSIYDQHLLVFDEITRGESQVYIRNSTLIKPHSILFVCTELAVAPIEQPSDSDEDEDDEDMGGGPKKTKLMEVPEENIAMVVDRWLKYQATSVEAAQVYCLRDRLLAALSFKVKHPRTSLPDMLAASVYALACILSYEGALDVQGKSTTTRSQGVFQYNSNSRPSPQEENRSSFANESRNYNQRRQAYSSSSSKYIPRDQQHKSSTSNTNFKYVPRNRQAN